MFSRRVWLEEFAGDLEYHPRRAILNLACATGVLTAWYFLPGGPRFGAVREGFLLGAITLAIKGVYLLRKSSEGIGLSDQELEEVGRKAGSKPFEPLPEFGQILQGFGAGPLLLGFAMTASSDSNRSGTTSEGWRVVLFGAIVFAVGWAIRRAATEAGDADRRL